MCKKRLDSRDVFPDGMDEYLELYGWHFSRKLCEDAVSRMKKKNRQGVEESLPLQTKEQVETLLRTYNVDPTGFIGYDHVYVFHMAKADFYGSSIMDEQKLATYVKDYLCDTDGYDEVAMTRYYADCIGQGRQILWRDML